jgi:riboflavin biosynthesis pyrimidine reductase
MAAPRSRQLAGFLAAAASRSRAPAHQAGDVPGRAHGHGQRREPVDHRARGAARRAATARRELRHRHRRGTVLADNCALTVRDESFELPGRRCCRRRRAAGPARGAGQPAAHTADCRGCSPGSSRHCWCTPKTAYCPIAWRDSGSGPCRCSTGRSTCGAVLTALAGRECNEILLESGPTLAGAVLREGWLDELLRLPGAAFAGQRRRGRCSSCPWTHGRGLDLRLVDQRRVGADLRWFSTSRRTPRPQLGPTRHERGVIACLPASSRRSA